MIKFEVGNILAAPAQCLVNTVNCEGFMGKGIAYQFKEKFPQNNKNYIDACKLKKFSIGEILFYSEKNKLIANFPTKNKWREKSQYLYIDLGLEALYQGLQKRADIQSIAIPPLGCGNGGLDWNIVKEKIIAKFKNSSLNITLYEPSPRFNSPTIEIPKLRTSHLILMKLKSYLSRKKFDKLRLQKSAYFFNIFSGTEYFKFEKYKFGPYAHSIEILSNQIKQFQLGYNVNTAKAEKILYGTIISESVKAALEQYENYILQAANFVNSILSDHELEIAATVVEIIRLFHNCQSDEIISSFFNWPKYDKTRFMPAEIERTIKFLTNSKIILRNLMGYEINGNIIQNKGLMPRYICD